MDYPLLVLLALFLYSISNISGQVQEFVSIDCGGTRNHTDQKTGLAWISDSTITSNGKAVEIQNPNEQEDERKQYQTRRDFPSDSNKYCYNLRTQERRRYIVRATFLYGLSKGNVDTYPKFQLYLDATMWASITVEDGSRIYSEEMVIRAPRDSIDVCLCCATTGSPFLSTLELRPLNLSMYATDYEADFYLKLAARVNFGAPTKDPIRYPDDPYDRIWESDQNKRQNFLVGVAAGTESISTSKTIDVNTREYPPVKVMQTAVLGTKGSLTYRLNLEDFPANARAFAYFAEIQNLGSNQSRKFRMAEPYVPDYSNAVVNIQENANGTYRLYEPSYMNVSLDFVLSFSFIKTPDSTEGPVLNAIEITKYVQIAPKTDTQDAAVLDNFRSVAPGSSWAQEEGDPCVPVSWDWVHCNQTSPPRITKVDLTSKNLQGVIPANIQNMTGLTELLLGGNSFTGSLPDISNLDSLKILHLENNKLTGTLPPYLGSLANLRELYIQNNRFSGHIPPSLLNGKLEKFEYEGNPKLTQGIQRSTHIKVIVGCSVAALAALVILLLATLFLLHKFKRKSTLQTNNNNNNESFHISTSKPTTSYSSLGKRQFKDEGVACYTKLSEIETATANFSRVIGRGSFGRVYYGKLKDGKEVAVKLMADTTSQRTKQFVTEVSLLSRIHHRNLVPLIGYCEEANQRMLIYEYMHNGTLRDHIADPVKQKKLDWLARLCIAEDAAKGLEYLHTGCNPSIIHRDVKTTNILLDKNMRAKVSDFGLSRQADEDLTHISSVARGTLGYLDPGYYANHQLTEKSDVYSFGVVLLELISGRKPISEDYGMDWNLIHWARSLIRKGDVISMIDPVIAGNVKPESVWRVAEVAIQCVEQRQGSRPKMQEIILAIQDAVKIEKGTDQSNLDTNSGGSSRKSPRKTLLTSFLEMESPDVSKSHITPSAR